jgi:branched-chain amino acid transport system substrate-binding protein
VAGVENCTIIGIRENEAYVTLQNTFEEAVRAQGVNIVGVEQIGIQDSDFAALSTKVASQDQDCVFVSAPASQAANVIVQLRQAGLDPDVRLFGHNSLASPQFVERGGAAVEGVTFIADWVPGGYDENSRAFDAAFTAQFGRAPDNWNAIGFGGLTIMANALSRAGDAPTRESMRDALASTSGVAVPAGQGLYALDAERVPRVGMSVLTVQNGAFVLAPR